MIDPIYLDLYGMECKKGHKAFYTDASLEAHQTWVDDPNHTGDGQTICYLCGGETEPFYVPGDSEEDILNKAALT